MKTSHVMGTVTIIAIVGGTIYAIKKHKDLEKRKDQEITVEEARDIVAKHKAKTEETVKFTQDIEEVEDDEEDFDDEEEDFDYEEVYVERHEPIHRDEMADIVAEAQDEASWNAGFNTSYSGSDQETIDNIVDEAHEVASHNTGTTEHAEFNMPYYDDDDDSDDKIGYFTEEDRKLRHEPNSMEALKQYKRMELAELEGANEVYQTMLRLFDFPFEPVNDGDHMLLTQIIDYRVRFFGFKSRWCKKVSFAEVILHYAKAAQFNCDESVGYWVEYFLSFNDLWYQYASTEFDRTISLLNAHKYFNKDRGTYGLFGIDSRSMEQAVRIANQNFDNSLTYEIEFQEFLKTCI